MNSTFNTAREAEPPVSSDLVTAGISARGVSNASSHMKKRKIIQIATTSDSDNAYPSIIALCDDGTVWRKIIRHDSTPAPWRRVETSFAKSEVES